MSLTKGRAGGRPARTPRRAVISFWVLVGLAVISAGVVTSSVAAPASPGTAVTFALSAVTLIISLALAGRVMRALDRTRRTAPVKPPQGTSEPQST